MKVSSSSGRVCGGGGGGGGVCSSSDGVDDNDTGSRGDVGGGGGGDVGGGDGVVSGGIPNYNNNNCNSPPYNVNDAGGVVGGAGEGGVCADSTGGAGLVAGLLVSDQGEVISDRYVGVARRQFASRQASERGSIKASHNHSDSCSTTSDDETTLRQMLVR